MKYKFIKEITNPPISSKVKPLIEFGVQVFDKQYEALEEILWHGWTPSEIQMIIDESKALTGNQEYKYQVEGSDLMIYIFTSEVFFSDLHNDNEEEDFKITFDEFITFMEDFKKFVAENQ